MSNDRPHWADMAIAVFTGLMLITYITGNYFSCQQFKLTQETVEEVRKGGTDTHDLAVASGKQADASKEISERTKAQATATNNLATAAERSAAAQENELQVQRQMLALSGGEDILVIDPIGLWSIDQQIRLILPLKTHLNYPLKAVDAYISIEFLPSTPTAPIDETLYDINDTKNPSCHAPNQAPWCQIDIYKARPAAYEDFMAGKRNLYIWGRIVYRDEVRTERPYRFCQYISFKKIDRSKAGKGPLGTLEKCLGYAPDGQKHSKPKYGPSKPATQS